jgi:hypothetical protein
VDELDAEVLSLDEVEPDDPDDEVSFELESLLALLDSFGASLPLLLSFGDDEPLAEDFEARESVTYQPLPLKTMPTG